MDKYLRLCSMTEDCEVLIEMAMDESDEEIEQEIVSSTGEIENEIHAQTLETLLDGFQKSGAEDNSSNSARRFFCSSIRSASNRNAGLRDGGF